MTRLSYGEKRLIEKILIHNGYVLDFSDRTFAEFFESEVGIDINDPVYRTNGTSKGNRLRTFFATADDATAGRALAALWDYERSLTSRTMDSGDLASMADLVARLRTPASHVPMAQGSASHAGGVVTALSALASYAHQGEFYDGLVLEVVQRLQRDGIEAISDHFVDFPPEGWPAWMDHELAKRRFVLVFAGERYKRCAEGKEEAGYGLGVIWEHGTIRRELYKAGRINERFLPVGFGPEQRKFVPDILHDYTYFDLDSAADYEKLLRVVRGTPHPLSGAAEVFSQLQPSRPSADAIATSYQVEDKIDLEYFGGWLPPMNGRFSIKLRPAKYDAERIARATLIDALGATRIQANGASDNSVMPFAQNTNVRGFGSGRGMEATLIDPQARRIEYVRIHRCGQFQLIRVFAEDYGDDNMLKFDKLELWNDDFIRRVTLLFLVAGRAANVIGQTQTDVLELQVGISGLGNRNIVSHPTPPSALEASLLAKATTNFDSILEKRWILTTNELERDGARLARELITDVYWNFSLTDPSLDEYIGRVQREQLSTVL